MINTTLFMMMMKMMKIFLLINNFASIPQMMFALPLLTILQTFVSKSKDD